MTSLDRGLYPIAGQRVLGHARGVLLRLQDDVLVLDPAAVVLLIGTNDLEGGAAPEVVAGDLKLILADLERHNPRMPIAWNGAPSRRKSVAASANVCFAIGVAGVRKGRHGHEPSSSVRAE